jgi:hypothetical protein
MTSKLKVNHKPGSTSAEVFLRNVKLIGNQYTLGNGGSYGYTIHLNPDEEDLDSLLDLFNAFAATHAEQHESLNGGYNPIDRADCTLTVSWKGKTKTTLWTDATGAKLENAPAIAEGGVVCVALETWSSVYEKDGDLRMGISFHPAQIRVIEAGDPSSRINNAFGDWISGDDGIDSAEDF